MPVAPDTATNLPILSLEDIAYLIAGGLDAENGFAPARYDLGEDRTLTYDLSDLTAAEAPVARVAMNAWTQVTGIRFVEEAMRPLPETETILETTDIPRGPHGTVQLKVNQTLQGETRIQGRDWIGIELEAGKSYVFDLQPGPGADASEMPWFRLISPEGKAVLGTATGLAAEGRSVIPFTPETSGIYYLSPEKFDALASGSYRVSAYEGDYLPDFVFVNDGSGQAFATNVERAGTIDFATIVISSDWVASTPNLNSYWLNTYIHEIGHVLGLSHPGNYNGTVDFETEAVFRNDSNINSIMSYLSGDMNPYLPVVDGVVMTPMPADILAAQLLYGSDVDLRPGDTTYGANSNVGGYLGRMFAARFDGADVPNTVWKGNPMLYAIYDTGGIDTLDYSPVRADQVISLRQGTVSITAGAKAPNMAIAQDTIIENAIGGRGNDVIQGNAAANRLQGRAGDDQLIGGKGDDTLHGGAGDDVLSGGAGHDLLRGGRGADVFHFTRGHDVIADFTAAMDGVVLAAERWAGLDTTTLLDSAELTAGGLVLWLAPQSSLTFRGLADASALVDSLLIG